ncbi:MAG: PA14 domain-containing protein, partial [Leeuwenhoekiella sp.]
GSSSENSLFTIGVRGDDQIASSKDDINLMASGSVGISTSTPNEAASLHLGRTDRGLLINKVALTDSKDQITVQGEEVNGLLVYNTTAAGTSPDNVIKGFYYWETDHWKLVDYGRNGIQYYSYYSSSGASPDMGAVERDSTIAKSGKYNGFLNTTALTNMQPRGDNFIVKIEGTYLVKNSGEFNFTSNSDDGARMYIDGALIIDQWTDSGDNNGSGKANLMKGKHKFEFWFYENGGGEKFTFSWGTNQDNHTGVIDTTLFTIK